MPRLVAIAGCALGLNAQTALADSTNDNEFAWEYQNPAQFPFFPGANQQLVVARPGVLNLRTGDVDTTRVANDLANGDGAFDSGWHVIMLDGPMDPQRRAVLLGLGIALGDYLPSNAFVADLSRTTRAAVRGLGFVNWAGVFQTPWKIDPEIGLIPMVTPARQALANAGRVALNIVLFPGADATAVKARVLAVPGVVLHRVDFSLGVGRLVVDLPGNQVAQLAAMPEVQIVEDAEEWSLRTTTTVRWVVQTNVTNQTPFYTAGIDGAGQIAGHLDGPIAEAQCGLDDSVDVGPTHRKIVADFAPGASTHGTQTAVIMLGKNLANPLDGSSGVAQGARLVHDVNPDLDSTTVGAKFTTFYSQFGAAVQCNSWGQDFTTAYKAGVREIDKFNFENDDNLIVFAVTNQANSLYIPENAKNVLAVSATSQSPNQKFWGIGGTGPTVDGRLKPELMSPGKNFFGPALPNANTNCGIVTQAPSGTSFACPSVAGTGLMARQYFMDGYYPTGVKVPEHAFLPSGALLKAVLVNGGDPMSAEASYPSNRTGWGRVLLADSLYLPGDARTTLVRDIRNNAARSLTTGVNAKMIFRVNSGQRLRVTLCWTDYPAALNSTFAPVNNLDLVVTDPASVSYLGNSFSGGTSTSGGVADSINNLEQVHLTSPAPGVWTIDVKGTAVQMMSQGYALAITGDITPCIADVDQDGAVTLDDFFAFFEAFDTGGAAADVDNDPGVTLDDFFAFFNAFDVGC